MSLFLETTRHYIPYNISFKEKRALMDLKNNDSLIIKPADKGGGIVLQERSIQIGNLKTTIQYGPLL